MHRSSESIAALAAALAKAQLELSNPEKSLVATISPDRSGKGTRTFRYAPLSSGLDIVRKTLGKHEIAIFQTTAIDQPTRSVSLTTMLTHSSGEWIASEWPVCSASDAATPHRMGAALTYARRYALFTLVGIAGEDDLDAPDLNCQPVTEAGLTLGSAADRIASSPLGSPAGRENRSGQGRPILDPDASAEARDRLLREIIKLPSEETAADWARTILPLKNTLSSRDARLVETAFAFRMSALQRPEPPAPTFGSTENQAIEPITHKRARGGIDKSALAFGEARRVRDKAHLKYVASRSCLVCGRQPSEPHHVRFAQKLALGRKVSDEFTVPLCRLHHRELHRSRNESFWWKKFGIDPIKIAAQLWDRTRSFRPPETGTAVALPVSALPLPETGAKDGAGRAERPARAGIRGIGRKSQTRQPPAPGPRGP